MKKKKFIAPTIGLLETTDQPLLTNASIVMGNEQGKTPMSTDQVFVVGAKGSFGLEF